MKLLGLLSARRTGLRCFRSIPNDLILLFVGVLVTVALVTRKYGERGGDDVKNGEVVNPLREISAHVASDTDDSADDAQLHVRSRLSRRDRQESSHAGSSVNSTPTMTSVDPRIRRIGDYRSQTCQNNRVEWGQFRVVPDVPDVVSRWIRIVPSAANTIPTFSTEATADRKWSSRAVLDVSEGGNQLGDPREVPICQENSLSAIVEQTLKNTYSMCQVIMTSAQVSIIVDFTDYEFYDVRNTIDSCMRLNSDDDELVRELIAVDDGSTLDYVIEESRSYFRSIAKATLLRHDPSSRSQGNNAGERLGTANARLAGVARSTGDVIVFLSPTVVCSPGWLEPLVDAITRRPNSIVTPHLDRIRDPISLEYQPTSDWIVGRLSWDLAIRMREIPPPPSSMDENEDERLPGSSPPPPKAPRYIKSAVARGDVFAVGRKFFSDIGGYDPMLAAEAVNGGAGEQVELSIRTWLCGGSVITATCSRVGVLNLHDPIKVTDRSSVQYIASLWFGSQQTIVVQTYDRYRPNFGIVDDVSNQTRTHAVRRRSTPFCDNSDKNRDIDWYLSNVAFDMLKPSVDAIAFGLLWVKTGRCGRALNDSRRILLEACRPQLYGRPTDDKIFQLTREGHLKVAGLCLTVQVNAYIVAGACVEGETRQLWKYKPSSGQLVNVWCHYCATHVTDPDLKTPGERQIMMAQECSADTSEGHEFTTWEFIAF